MHSAPAAHGLDAILELEAQLRQSIWLFLDEESFHDLDSNEMLPTIQANIARGIEYRLIMPEGADAVGFDGLPAELTGHYMVRSVPRTLADMLVPFQLNDPEQRTRRGFFIHRAGPDYSWLEMDADVLRKLIRSYKYLWDLPARVRQAIHYDEKPADNVPELIRTDFREGVTCMKLGQNRAAVILFARCLECLLGAYCSERGVDTSGPVGLGTFIGRIKASAKDGVWFLDSRTMHETLLATASAINQFRIANVHSREQSRYPDAPTVEMVYRQLLTICLEYLRWTQGEGIEAP